MEEKERGQPRAYLWVTTDNTLIPGLTVMFNAINYTALSAAKQAISHDFIISVLW